MTIACLGITVLDRIFRVSKLPTEGGKFIASDYFEVGGGPAATAAVTVKRQGYDVDFIGRVGGDSVATAMLDEFQRYQVNTDKVRQIEDALSSFSAILVDNEGERMIINYQDASLPIEADWLDNVDFSQYEALLCDVRWHNGAKKALQEAKKNNIPSVLDADLTDQDISELVELAGHSVFSQPGLAKFTGTTDAAEGLRLAQERTSGRVYVTLGSEGCMWLEDGELLQQDGFKVDVKDTTGAGDVFHGAFAVALARKMSSRDAIAFSSAVAALKCTKMGGREGIPTQKMVDDFIATK